MRHLLRTTLAALACSITALVLPAFAAADTVTWDGGGGDPFLSNPANWDGNVRPTALDDAVIGDAGPSYLYLYTGGPFDAASLTISADTLLAVGDPLRLHGDAAYQLTVTAPAQLGVTTGYLQDPSAVGGHAVGIGGDGTAGLEGPIVATDTQAFVIGPDVIVEQSGAAALPPSVDDVTVHGTWSGAATSIDADATMTVASGGTLRATAGVLQASLPLAVASGGTLETVGLGAIAPLEGSTLAGGARITLGSDDGAILFSGADDHVLTGDVDVSGDGGDLQVAGQSALDLGSHVLDLDADDGASARLQVTGNAPGDGVLDGAGGRVINGAVQFDGDMVRTGGAARLGAGAVGSTGTGAELVAGANLTIANGADLVLGDDLALDPAADLEIGFDGRLDLADFAVTGTPTPGNTALHLDFGSVLTNSHDTGAIGVTTTLNPLARVKLLNGQDISFATPGVLTNLDVGANRLDGGIWELDEGSTVQFEDPDPIDELTNTHVVVEQGGGFRTSGGADALTAGAGVLDVGSAAILVLNGIDAPLTFTTARSVRVLGGVFEVGPGADATIAGVTVADSGASDQLVVDATATLHAPISATDGVAIRVDGTVDGEVDLVDPNTQLTGTGTVGALDVSGSASVAPGGDDPGTLAVAGSATFGPSGVLRAEVRGYDIADSSKLIVGGPATIDPTASLAVITSGFTPSPSFERVVLSAGSFVGTGRFGTPNVLDGPLSPGVAYGVAHDATSTSLRAVDVGAPTPPISSVATSHLPGASSSDRTLRVRVDGATDPSGIAGYGVAWDFNAVRTPLSVITHPGSGPLIITSPPLANGTWYVHIVAIDAAGNASAATHLGPFVIIDGPPPINPIGVPPGQVTTGGVFIPQVVTPPPPAAIPTKPIAPRAAAIRTVGALTFARLGASGVLRVTLPVTEPRVVTTVRLQLTAAQARALGLPVRRGQATFLIGTGRATSTRAGTLTVSVQLTRAAKLALARAAGPTSTLRTVRGTLLVQLAKGQLTSRVVAKSITFKR